MWVTSLLYICLALLTYFYCVTNHGKMVKRLIFNLYFSIFHISVMSLLIIWPFPMLNGRTVENGKIWSRIVKHVTKVFRVRWELRNGQVLAKDRGAVIVANHQSVLDIVGMFNIWETIDKMSIVTKKEALYTGPFGVVAYFIGCAFLDRRNPKNAYQQLKTTANLINKKIKIWIFPEGTRNFDYTKFLPFKKGAFVMAVAAQAPIIPLVFSPFYFIDRKNYKLNTGRVIIQCLDEVSTVGLTTDDVPELIERVRNMMLAAYEELSKEVLTNTPQICDIKKINVITEHL